MKLATTTGDFSIYYQDRSIAAPINAFPATPFRHLDMSFYRIIYKDSPWLAPGDGWKKEVEDSLKLAQTYGYDFVQAHAPDGEHFQDGEARDALILATKRSIEACRMLDIPFTVIHCAQCGEGIDRFRKENIAFLKLFEETAEQSGVDILIENSADLWAPQYYLNNGKLMREFLDEAQMPRLFLNWDVGHANVQGLDQYSDILAMGDKLRALHVQDNCGNGDAHAMPMTGTTNFDDLIRGLLQIGYQGPFTFEGGNTLRHVDAWPFHRRNVKPEDRLANPPLHLQQKQISLMYDTGAWMLERYGIPVE